MLEDSGSAHAAGLEEDAAAWVRDAMTRYDATFSLLVTSYFLFAPGAAVPAESPGVQPAAGSLEQVSCLFAVCRPDRRVRVSRPLLFQRPRCAEPGGV